MINEKREKLTQTQQLLPGDNSVFNKICLLFCAVSANEEGANSRVKNE